MADAETNVKTIGLYRLLIRTVTIVPIVKGKTNFTCYSTIYSIYNALFIINHHDVGISIFYTKCRYVDNI